MIAALLLYFISLAMLGFTVGCGVYAYKKSTTYNQFMNEHPILGWTATITTAGLILYGEFLFLLLTVATILVMLGLTNLAVQ